MTHAHHMLAGVLFLALACPATAGEPWKGSDRTSKLEAFAACLKSHAQGDGIYAWFDGGDSATRLVTVACKIQWATWRDDCLTLGGTDGGWGGCTMQASMLAQFMLVATACQMNDEAACQRLGHLSGWSNEGGPSK
jgi:hypothetical protein